MGPTPQFGPSIFSPGSRAGPFTTHYFYSASDYQDGLSQTIGLSERLQGDWTTDVFSRGDYLLSNLAGNPLGATHWDADRAVAACSSLGVGSQYDSRAGESWFLSGFHFTNYNHCDTPNSPRYDCSFNDKINALPVRVLLNGVFTARSAHRGGVNVLLMDGSVRSVGDTVNLRVWRALATRSGGEVISADSY